MTVKVEALDGDTSPPAAVSFFDPSIKEVRERVFYQWARTLLILCVFVFGVLSLFWGAQYGTEAKYPALKVWIVDFDGQVEPYSSNDTIVGSAVTDATKRILQSDGFHLGYTIKSPADFNYDPLVVRQGIYDEHAYAAVIVKPNATALLRDAVSNGNATYDPTGAIETVIISARHETTYYTYILPDLANLQGMVLAGFGPKWVQSLVSSVGNLSSVPPQAINPGIGFTTVDLRPFGPAVIAPAVTIGLIYLIIIAFFNFPFMMPIHAQFMKSNGHPPLKVPHWLIWRILSSIVAYFFLSLFYSLVSLAFKIPFSNDSASNVLSAKNPNAYGRGSFVVFWMLNWVGMAALGFPCENMAMVLGFPWSSLFLIFWVITNVATGFYDIDLAPKFYRWGYAWPLHRIVDALRTIIFDIHSRIGLDFAILFIWIAISLAFYPFAAFIMRWKMKRGV
ncbi:unnamed protein product [Penicillium nalgiovense]|uniref:DUF3533 domain-containing protein n=1 Tax=Penicillium nalgiovense TaxID=60175 RepID=A0A1V6Z716_PENNA|nr:hypothetical protein PENNAL_c0002G02745 [Penicillium nalgiovense]CAG7942264.1 unnamed protein product [Penicillium nalgiovense]CAG7965365.1 unnamed protein product [Penicillium nalgiovense]CAG8003072.1 unnamed protein product [Penicillium nalgiovense]CAG8011594.1 unnamed protein product [Penicillium nalgiovense]